MNATQLNNMSTLITVVCRLEPRSAAGINVWNLISFAEEGILFQSNGPFVFD